MSDVGWCHPEKLKDITLTLEPPPIITKRIVEWRPSVEPDSPFPYTPTDSPLRPPIQKAKASISSLTPSLATPPLDCCSTGDPPRAFTVDRLAFSSSLTLAGPQEL
ncbi:APC membrane recruitment protein 2 [Lates japonicus]|uniref:APC membrane recruitment protein 2 n=1 Tax=Lates japonicus TaxID=270547 RepID=A0AAD3MIR8_LATJO|nr:APC membrane recruitment protein 2 [Lates japonicus]